MISQSMRAALGKFVRFSTYLDREKNTLEFFGKYSSNMNTSSEHEYIKCLKYRFHSKCFGSFFKECIDMKQILLKDSNVQKPECIQYITSGFSIQISCPVPDCKVSVPMSVMEKYLGIRSTTTTTTSATTTTNKPAAANIVTPSNGGDQPHQESFSKKCPGCEKVVSFVPDKHTSANDINISHSVDCGNGHFFCWECTSLQGHAPLACDLWEKWHEKCSKMDTIGKEKTYNIVNLTFQTQRSSFFGPLLQWCSSRVLFRTFDLHFLFINGSELLYADDTWYVYRALTISKAIVIDRNPILYFWPNQNHNRNAVAETESKPKVNGKY